MIAGVTPLVLNTPVTCPVGSGGSEKKLVIMFYVSESGLWGYLGAQGLLGGVGWLHKVQGTEMGTALSVWSAGSILGWNADTCTHILSLGGLARVKKDKEQISQRTMEDYQSEIYKQCALIEGRELDHPLSLELRTQRVGELSVGAKWMRAP